MMKKQKFHFGEIPPPKKILEHLDTYVVGQEYAKKVLSVAVYNHYKGIHKDLVVQKSQINADWQKENYNTYKDLGYIIKNKEIKQKSITLGSNQLELKKSNIMLIGPTGTGKTLLAQKMAKFLNIPFAIFDCSSLSQSRYARKDIDSIITALYRNAEYNVNRTETGIIFLDKVDEIAIVKGAYRDAARKSVQQELLKILEGTIVSIPQGATTERYGNRVQVDTTNILFIASGVYNEINELIMNRKYKYGADDSTENDNKNILFQVETKDLINFGMMPEFIDRFPALVPFHALDKDMVLRILTEPKDAVILQYQKLFSREEVKLTFDSEALKAIASFTIEKEMGARGLREVIEDLLLEPMVEIPKSDIISVHITEQCAKGLEKPKYARSKYIFIKRCLEEYVWRIWRCGWSMFEGFGDVIVRCLCFLKYFFKFLFWIRKYIFLYFYVNGSISWKMVGLSIFILLYLYFYLMEYVILLLE